MNYMDIVFDASTLILLAKIDLLRGIADRYGVIISDKVREEVLASEKPDAIVIRYLLDNSLIRVVPIGNRQQFEKIAADFRIHAGEAESLCLARELSTPLAVDDGPAIKACKVIGVSFITAIHFVIYGAQSGVISQSITLEKLKKLSIAGRYRTQIMQDAEKRITGGRP
jgi:predicted nucleic acid-binding protein